MTAKESMDVDTALRLVARHYYGDAGVWTYQAFDWVNAELFDGALPTPLIQWGLTAHGACLGLTRSATDRGPVVTLHPSLFGGTERENPWQVNPAWLGARFAFDVLLHELIHVSVTYRLGGWRQAGGESSHNNPLWIAECNRIAPRIGLADITTGRSVVKRVVIPGELMPSGRPRTKPTRVTEGNVPFPAVARFPSGVRSYLNSAAAYYTTASPPFPASVPIPAGAPR
jgi:hypothetical protein